MNDKYVQSQEKRLVNFKKITKIDFPFPKPLLHILPEKSPLFQNHPDNTQMHLLAPEHHQTIRIASSKFIEPEQNNKKISMHRTMPYSLKSKKQKFYLWGSKTSRNKEKQFNSLFFSPNNQRKDEERQEKERTEKEKNFLATHHFNLTVLPKREQLEKVMRGKAVRERSKKLIDKSLFSGKITQTSDLWNHGRSRSTFYPSKNLEFKTLNVVPQTIEVDQGITKHKRKYYPKIKPIQPFQIEVQKAPLSNRKNKLMNDHKMISSPPIKSTTFMVHEEQKRRRLRRESRQLMKGIQINGWEVDEQILS